MAIRRYEQKKEQRRDGEDRVDDPHHGPVNHPAGEAGYRPPDGAEAGGEHRHGQCDDQCGLATRHQPADDVVAGVIRSEQVLQAGSPIRDRHVRLYLVGVVNERADEAEQHEEHDDPDPDDSQPVFHEHADGGLEQVRALLARRIPGELP